jgi:anti-anti-sigma regulatory factor
MEIQSRRNRPNHELILLVSGDLDPRTAPELRRAFYACDAANSARITLDVAELRIRGWEGLAAIVDAYRASHIAGGRLRIVRPSVALRTFVNARGYGWLLANAGTEGESVSRELFAERNVIGAVREGMNVIDANGDRLGVVASVAPSDADAALTVHRELIEEYEPALPAPNVPGGAIGPTAAGGPVPVPVRPAEPDVAPELAEQLLRTGYVRIDSSGFFHRDRYAGAEQLDRIAGETLYLAATKNDLPNQS